MAGLDPAIQLKFGNRRLWPWMAAHVLGLDPWIKCGHDNQSVATEAEFLPMLAGVYDGRSFAAKLVSY
jgi:hypothetical protein